MRAFHRRRERHYKGKSQKVKTMMEQSLD